VVIDVYDILQSKEDKATVPIYYEARLAANSRGPSGADNGCATAANKAVTPYPWEFQPSVCKCSARVPLKCPATVAQKIYNLTVVRPDEGSHSKASTGG
jgi:hypothetical protein